MSNPFHSIRLKLLVAALVSGAVFLALVGKVSDTYVRSTFDHEFHEHSVRAAVLITVMAKDEQKPTGPSMTHKLLQAKASDSEGIIERIHLHMLKGKKAVTVASTIASEVGSQADADDAMPLHTAKSTYKEVPGFVEVHRLIKLGNGDKAVLGVYFSTAERERQIAGLSSHTMPLRVGSLLGLLVAVFLIGEYFILRPLDRLRITAKRIAAGDVEQELVVGSHDEVGALGASLEEMRVALTTYSANLEQSLNELTLLYNISKVSSSSANVEMSLQVILESAVKALGGTCGVVMLSSKSRAGRTGELRVRASFGCSDAGNLLQDPGNAMASRVMETGEPLLMVEGGAGWGQANPVHDAIAVPIVISGAATGVLAVGGKQDGTFGQGDVQLLSTLANQASGAINLARLFEDLQASYLSTVQALAAAIDAKDRYTRGHSGRVVKYCQLLAKELQCSEADTEAIKIAAYLHDLGKIGIDEQILLKKENLTPAEYRVIREHPTLSATIVSRVTFLEHVVPLVKHHHERFGGGGYPDGIKGESIPLGARILAVADSFDAMTSDRPYRKALSTKAAVAELVQGAGKQFDPNVVAAFLKLARVEVPEPVGQWQDALVDG